MTARLRLIDDASASCKTLALGHTTEDGSEATPIRRHDDIIGQSDAMQPVLDVVARVAGTETTVLVTGDSGTGKEVIARAIHRRSRRSGRPFVAVNCAAVPETLLESELFGHVRGAFTDARTSRGGLFEQADGGTLLLDEIGDMPLSLQPKLLRVLEDRAVRPVGGREERPVDVRLIAATNRDLESEIAAGRFREDLFYRINVVEIALPPLRARRDDLLPLARHFLAEVARREERAVSTISRAAAERLLAYPWPGNVRELRNCVERAVALARSDAIAPDDLPRKVREYRGTDIADTPTDLVPLEQLERLHIKRVMEAVEGNKSAAARILGIDRKRLHRMLTRLGLER